MHKHTPLALVLLSSFMLMGSRCTPFGVGDGPGSVPLGTLRDAGGGAIACAADADCPFGQECFMAQCRPVNTDVGDTGCATDMDCPEGNLCAQSTGKCVSAASVPELPPPTTGDCAEGQRRVCGTKVGACEFGTEDCVNGAWSGTCAGGVTPVAERCDGVDNNCDGDVDEGFVLGDACERGLGVCRESGVTTCAADGAGTTCSVTGLDTTGRAELCGNALDDDCDGDTDEGFVTTLGTACDVGRGACMRSGTLICTEDQLGTRCSAQEGPAGPEELCGNNVDDDCDGMTDEGFVDQLGTACTVGTDMCAAAGIRVCSPDLTTLRCQPTAMTAELCNGMDDTGEGCTDEGFELGVPCTAGVGACRTVGSTVCSMDGMGTTCGALPLDPTGRTELCGNGIDDDCDGSVDEGFPDVGTSCPVGRGICQRDGSRVCSADRLTTTCQGTAGFPDSRGELCGNNLDDDCDGTTDEGFNVGTACMVGTGACARPGTQQCTADRLATTCSGTAGTPGMELCGNNVDDDCDTFTDEGFPNLGTPCTAGLGVCARPGTFVCSADRSATVCGATAGTSTPEVCDNLDNDCDGTVDNGCDDDGDRYCDAGMTVMGTPTICPNTTSAALRDCNDTDAAINPGAMEVCGDNRDQDCDGDNNNGCGCGAVRDADFDGFNSTACGGMDCDDTNGSISPGATERCDGADNNCNGTIDEGFDADMDNYTTCGTIRPAGGLDNSYIDCDDTNATRHPFACELCANAMVTVACGAANDRGNNVDEDCDGYTDETCAPCDAVDRDGDMFSQCDGDCAPTDPAVAPGRMEVCDGKDTDCNRNTTRNCEVGDRCAWTGTPVPDVCGDRLICVESLAGNGRPTGNYSCTSLCNFSPQGTGLGDGCTSTQTCSSSLSPTANLHGCTVNSSFGSLGVGTSCTDDAQCRSGVCFRDSRYAGNVRYCTDLCSSDAYCGNDTFCMLYGDTGRCMRRLASQANAIGTACTVGGTTSYSCNRGPRACIPNGTNGLCSQACCSEAGCPSGYHCSFKGNDTLGVLMNGYDTTTVCFPDGAGAHDRPAGAACTSNGQCRSEFCDRTLNICVETCCNDAACPSGLTCEATVIQRAGNRPTFGRVCIGLTPTTPLQAY